MAETMKDLLEFLVKLSPVFEVVAPLVGGVSSLLYGVPQASCGVAVGLAPQFPDAAGVGVASLKIEEMASSSRFLTSIVLAVTDDPVRLVITLLLVCVTIAVGVWLRSRTSIALRAPQALRLACFTIALLSALVAIAALLYPRYAAPTRIEDLGVRLEDPREFEDGIFWSRCELDQFGQLYSWLHGVDLAEPPAPERERGFPTNTDLRKVREYYDRLAAYSVWSLAGVLTLSLLASAALPGLRTARPPMVAVICFLLIAAAVVNLTQWILLGTAYGRLVAPQEAIQLPPGLRDLNSLPDMINHWPFSTPDIIEIGSDTTKIRNFWPVPSSSGGFALGVQCIAPEQESPPRFDRVFKPHEVKIRSYENGVTEFNFGKIELWRLCAPSEPRRAFFVTLYDGHGHTGAYPVTGQ